MELQEHSRRDINPTYGNFRRPPSNTSQSLDRNFLRGNHFSPGINYGISKFTNNENPIQRNEASLLRVSPYKKNKQQSLEDRNFLIKSRITHYNGSQLGDKQKGSEFFSEELIFLLSNEDSNIEYFKTKIDLEKERVIKDFDHFRNQIEHIVQDLMGSLQAELDIAYKDFIRMYSELKNQVGLFKKLREKVLLNIAYGGGDQFGSINKSKSNVSNFDILHEVEKDAEMLRNQHVYAQLGQLQKQRMGPIMQLVQKIVICGAVEKTYYRDQQTNKFLSQTKGFLQRQITRQGFQDLPHFVYSCNRVVEMQLKQREENNMILKINQIDSQNVSMSERKPDISRQKRLNPHGQNDYGLGLGGQSPYQQDKSQEHRNLYRNQYPSKQQHNAYQLNPPNETSSYKNPFIDRKNQLFVRGNRFQYNRLPTNDVGGNLNIPGNRHLGFQQVDIGPRPYSEPKTIRESSLKREQEPSARPFKNKDYQRTQNKNLAVQISNDQQSLITTWVEDISLQNENRLELRQHSDIVLCGLYVKDGRYFATGSKDTNIHIYDISTGKLVIRLVGHKASICCMAIINGGEFLASGGDYGCSSVILWDVKSWTIKHRLQAHTAAVTAIVDLQDGQNIASTGYDKKINIISYRNRQQFRNNQSKPKLLFTIVNKASISCLALNGQKTRLLASGLDKTVMVWKIERKQSDRTFHGLTAERTIPNSELVCSLKSLQLSKEIYICGTKDGKIRLVNMQTGQTLSTFTVSDNSVIDLLVLERKIKTEMPLIISCGSKDRELKLIKSDVGVIESINISGKMHVEYGCGIGPKIIFNSQEKLAIVSQSGFNKQVTFYDIIIK